MRPKLTLHIGIHKTGTTSVQIALKQNYDSGNLAKAQVNYVSATRGSTNAHHTFAQLTHQAPGSDKHLRDLTSISDEVLAQPDILHVMSSEVFDLCAPDAHRLLRDHFVKSGINVGIVMTLRDAGSLLGSVFQQHLKQGLIAPDESAFIEAVTASRDNISGKSFVPYVHMDKFIASLSEIYGKDALKLVHYKDIFSSSRGLAFFLESVGADTSMAEFSSLPFVNETLSLEKLSYLSWLAAELRHLKTGPVGHSGLKSSLDILSKTDVPGTRYIFPIQDDAIELCEVIKCGLRDLHRQETIPLQVVPDACPGTPLLPLKQIPKSQLQRFFTLTAQSLDPRLRDELKVSVVRLIGTGAEVP